MSTRKNTLIHQVASDQSLTTSFNTSPTVVRNHDNCSYQINVTTVDSTGTFAVEVSNDYYVEPGTLVITNPGNWIPLTLAGGTPTVAATDTLITINLNQLPFYAMRLSYVAGTPGTGTCNVYVSDKEIG